MRVWHYFKYVAIGLGIAFVGTPVTAQVNLPCTAASAVGLVGDGVTSNDAAFNTWWTSFGTGNSCLELGVGKYRFNSIIFKSMAAQRQSVTIKGQSPDASIFYFPNASGGITITNAIGSNSVHFSNFSITTGQTNLNKALLLDSPGILNLFATFSHIINVTIRGDDYTGNTINTTCWNGNFETHGWSNIIVDNLTTYGIIGAPGSSGCGTGITVGGVGTNIMGSVWVSRSNFVWMNIGVWLNSYWEDFRCDLCGLGGETGAAGFYVPPGMTHTGPQFQISRSGLNGAGTQITLQSPVDQVQIFNNAITAFGNSAAGFFHATNSTGFMIEGNVFNAAGGTGTVGVVTNGRDGIISGNTFFGLATGVFLIGNTTDVTVQGNIYSNVTTTVTNTGTGNRIGIATQ